MKRLHIYLIGLLAVTSHAFAEESSAAAHQQDDDAVVFEHSEAEEVTEATGETAGNDIATPREVMLMDDIEIVEVPRTEIEGASRTSEVTDSIPEVTSPLPDDTVVQMQLSGAGEGSVASMSEDETISVDFPDDDVRTILRSVADLFDLNLVIPETLQGRTSLKLRNVTWPQVFEVVLDPLGFTYIQDRNIIRIRATADLDQEPMDTRVFIINYARANEITGSIQPLIDSSLGGRIQVDRRLNALVITERPSRMPRIGDIIARLDRQTQQVMIQSKFVEVRLNDGRDLGLDWASLGAEEGVGVGVGPFGSRVTNSSLAVEANTGFVQGSLESTGPLTRNPLDTAVFNAAAFNTVLNALQSRNNVRLVTNPTVVTMDGEKAEIKITREFPQPDFTFNAQTGQRQFNGLGQPIDVGISLEVTPSVNSDGFISLDVFPEVSSTTEDRVIEGTQFPVRDVRTARTRITIKDGFTLALGGLVESSETDVERKVPFLGDVPGVGRLFRTNSRSNEETNLIIFITARTLNPDGTTYEEIIDPRQLDRMEIIPSDVPGYIPTEEERNRLRQLRELRGQERDAFRSEKQQAEIESIEAQRRAAIEAAEMNSAEDSSEPRRLVRGELR